MSWHRRPRPATKDETHVAIVAALVAAGCSVIELHAVGGGCPDVLVGCRGYNYLLEIKTPGWETRSMGKLKAKVHARQAAVRAGWRGWPIDVVESVAQAFAAVGL